jgi:hypothetical protein
VITTFPRKVIGYLQNNIILKEGIAVRVIAGTVLMALMAGQVRLNFTVFGIIFVRFFYWNDLLTQKKKRL